ncbi:CRISPR system single-strand-specific deoxyribonuclease Cas10/Csm1 (subtype III-A) [subsurface metagenome]
MKHSPTRVEAVDQNVKEYQTVLLAALLHDVGKLLGRGHFALLDKGQHPRFSAEFVGAFQEIFSQVSDVSLLRELVQRHHESKEYFSSEFLVQSIEDKHVRTLATLVSKADNLSSSERGTRSEQWQDYRETPLASVLERVNRVGDASPQLRYHARPLCPTASVDVIFPDKITAYAQGELNRHIKEFGEDFRNLFQDSTLGAVDTTDFDCLISHVFNVLYKYTWCIPSNTQETVPDVSLCDHLKTTAAIASCLYLYHSHMQTLDEHELDRTDVNRFCLAVGDLSGIQRYIFDIATIGAGGGIARRLRSRSLYVQLCAEVAAHLILRRLNLPIVIHTVMNSGGRFYLLLPNLPETSTVLGEIQRTVDTWFLRELNGELALNLACVQFGDDGFKAGEHGESGFGKIVEAVNLALNSRKRNIFAEALHVSGHWAEDSFKIDASYEGRDACRSCKKFPQTEGEEGFCSHCQLDREIGAILPDAKYLAFFDSQAGKIPVLGHSVEVWESPPPSLGDNSRYLVMKLNDSDLANIARYPAVSKYIAKFVAKADNCEICREADSTIATFDCIAQRSDGEELLGFLKADVDRLGESFIFGLKRETASVDTISRVSTLSRMLDLFFSGWIEHLMAESGDFYTVFSGGDDLFLVGPWDKILDIAEKIRVDFAEFTGNPSLTISAGVAIARHNYPIASAAQAADDAMKVSKERGGDRVTVLRTTLTWPDWTKMKAEWVRLRPLVREAPSAFLYSLLRFAAMWRRYKVDDDTLGLRLRPLLAYSISRNLDPKKTPELCQWADRLLAIRPGDKEHEVILDNLGLIASLLIYSKRGGGE